MHDRAMLFAGLTIRPLRAGDLPGLIALFNGARKSGQPAFPVPRLPETIRRQIERQNQSSIRLIALLADEIVAQASLSLSPHIGRLTITVDDRCRGHGTGSALLEQMIAIASERALTQIELSVFSDNVPALALYKKFGFEIEARHTGQNGCEILSMIRAIPGSAFSCPCTQMF